MLGQGPLVYWFYFRDGLFVIYLASNLSLVVVGEFITLTKKCSSTAFRKSISKYIDKSNRTKVRKSSILQRTLAVERCLWSPPCRLATSFSSLSPPTSLEGSDLSSTSLTASPLAARYWKSTTCYTSHLVFRWSQWHCPGEGDCSSRDDPCRRPLGHWPTGRPVDQVDTIQWFGGKNSKSIFESQ